LEVTIVRTWLFVIGATALLFPLLGGCQKAEKAANITPPAKIAKNQPTAPATETTTPATSTPTTQAPDPAPVTTQVPATTPPPAVTKPDTTPPAVIKQPGSAAEPPATPQPAPAPITPTIPTRPETAFLLEADFVLFMASADGRKFAKTGYENTIMGSRFKDSKPPRNTAYYDAMACTTSNEHELERAMTSINQKITSPQFARDLGLIRDGYSYWKQQHNRTTYR
jgi:hypothetical protein